MSETVGLTQTVRLTHEGEIAVITIDNPPVNAIGPGVPEGIQACMAAAAADSGVAAIVMIGAGKTFIAGADIREFGKIVSGQRPRLILLPVLSAIEDCLKPVIMAIHGQALGGGMEVAMAGHYRVIAPAAQVGQPEVKLGIIPGAAGTQRLPRLAGIAKAVEMCAFGEPVSAADALAAGMVDRLIEGDLLTGAITFAREVVGRPIPRTSQRNQKLDGALAGNGPEIFAAARRLAQKTRRGQTAPLAAIEAVEAATRLPFAEGCAYEAELFRQCLYSTQSKTLIHAFFAERAVWKIPDIPAATPTGEIRRAAVIGAGTMGGGITMNYANAGIPVIVKEATQEALDRGMATIRNHYAGSVQRGRLSQAAMDERMARITPQLDYAGFQEADIIAEAVFEGMALKKQVFAEIDAIAKPGCILASNTSYLDIDEIASVTKRPEMVLGNHYFSPANVMRLLEIVRGKATSREAIATCMALARRMKKVPVVAGNCRGFIGNRMLGPYLREAQFLLEEGATVETVNQALFDFGMAMGPLAMSDLAGLDVGWRIRQEFRHLERPGVRQPLVADRLCAMGRFGQKTGRGWSLYDQQRNPSPDPETAALIEKTAREAGVERRTITAGEVVDRCVFALINEGAKLLEEGIALRSSDIDVVYLNGYGFPAWRGGPMFYGDTVGLGQVLARIAEWERRHGEELWSPAPLLVRLAAEGKTFASLG
ncbi:MAG TPA: 3-hydroxyacyl-CoA dehydrogenase NAD-binding domain-containing protein [Candidatus Acidoferrales bacterium]|jgi:3-hydroxyacyl-CoA dehydrogenase|nr:3-hydroxyacyl-CoA dehydrogenase NAD-binding domain-containing protein [Candidatus Acidoferrales bacterium]